MKSNNGVDRLSRRRLIERLSGWRLTAFFVSAAVNLGLLVGLTVLPLVLNPARLFVVTAWVLASHCVFLIAVADFRFSISTKFALGLAHATACLWALASIEALPWVRLGNREVATLYLIPMLTLGVTFGGIAIARLAGFHRSKRFSVGDLMLLVTMFAILFPLILQLVPRTFITEGVSAANLGSAFAVAATTGVTCLLVSNLYLKFIPTDKQGLSPWMLVIGWFLLISMIDWNLCHIGFQVSIWILFSLIPIYGISHHSVDHEQTNPGHARNPGLH